MSVATTLLPNSTQVPNLYFDEFMFWLEGDEWKALSYAVRHILGFDDRRATRRRRISVSTFENGYGPFPGCGLGRTAILTATGTLSKFGLLIKVGEPTEEGQEWELPITTDTVNLAGLKERFQQKRARIAERTKTAREKKDLKKKQSDGQTTLESDNQQGEVVCLSDRGWSDGQTGGGLMVRHKETNSQTNSQTDKDSAPEKSADTAPEIQPVPPAAQPPSEKVSDELRAPAATLTPTKPSRPKNIPQEAVAFAFKVKPGAYAGVLLGQLTGTTKKGKRKEWLVEPAMTPEEIVGLKSWYEVYHADSEHVPHSADLLYERVLEFRDHDRHDHYVERGKTKLAELLGQPKPLPAITPVQPVSPPPAPMTGETVDPARVIAMMRQLSDSKKG